MTNRRKTIAGFVLALATLTACGDDSADATSVNGYGYSFDEVRNGSDVYLCINNLSTSSMWCENIGLGGTGA